MRRLGDALLSSAWWSSCIAAVAAFIPDARHRHRGQSPREQCSFDRGRALWADNIGLGVAEDRGLHPLSELRRTSYEALVKRMPPSVRVVLIGEGTHGTEEFFRIRSEITRCLLQRRGFDAVLCEGDVRPFFELNKFVTGHDETGVDAEKRAGNERDATKEAPEAVRSMLSRLFGNHFPDWMWSNMPMADLVSWLRTFNSDARRKSLPAQIFGIDIQSPRGSMEYVVQQLSKMGEEELSRSVQGCYDTLLSYQDNIRKYGNDVYANRVPSQEEEVKKAHDLLMQQYKHKTAANSLPNSKEQLWIELIENSWAVVSSESCHRQRLYPGHTVTWNLRTKAMMGSISRSMKHIDRLSRTSAAETAHEPPRLVVWAHNSHVGDMRSTGYASLGQISLGQLCREEFGDDRVFLIGMTTFKGTVRTAYADRQGACWKGDGEFMALREAIDDSHESFLHAVADNSGEQSFGLYLRPMRDANDERVTFDCSRDERFIGSCYLPQTELMSHYSKCNMATQFDYIFHVDESSAITI